MEKIPVGATIAHAYSFAFGDFFKILGVAWLPLVITSGVGYFFVLQMPAYFSAAAAHNFAAMGQIGLWVWPLDLLMLVLVFVLVAGITQLALGLRTGSPFFYFSLGKPVWRLIGAALIVVVVMIVGYIAVLIGGGAASILVIKVLPGLAGKALAGLILFTILCAYIYVLTRLSFLLNPVVIAERKIGVGRAWSLGRGNVWRMFVIFLVTVVIPVFVIETIFLSSIASLLIGSLSSMAGHMSPDQLHAVLMQWVFNILTMEKNYWYIVFPISGITSALIYGLWIGAQSFAYRALVPDRDSTQIFS